MGAASVLRTTGLNVATSVHHDDSPIGPNETPVSISRGMEPVRGWRCECCVRLVEPQGADTTTRATSAWSPAIRGLRLRLIVVAGDGQVVLASRW